MSKNPNFKSYDDGDEEDDDDDVDDDDGDDDETLRRGCCVKRLTRHMARVPFEGGGPFLSVCCITARFPRNSKGKSLLKRVTDSGTDVTSKHGRA